MQSHAINRGIDMKKRMISVVLSLVLLASFVSCRYNESQQRIYDAAHNAGAHSANENVSEFESGVKDLLTKYQGTQETDAETALLSRSVFFSPEDLAAMKVTVNNLSFTYPYANLSDVESAYKTVSNAALLSRHSTTRVGD